VKAGGRLNLSDSVSLAGIQKIVGDIEKKKANPVGLALLNKVVRVRRWLCGLSFSRAFWLPEGHGSRRTPFPRKQR
jgi:hypothetical protein